MCKTAPYLFDLSGRSDVSNPFRSGNDTTRLLRMWTAVHGHALHMRACRPLCMGMHAHFADKPRRLRDGRFAPYFSTSSGHLIRDLSSETGTLSRARFNTSTEGVFRTRFTMTAPDCLISPGNLKG